MNRRNEPQVIYINGRFLTQSITGVQRFAREMVSALDQILPNQYRVVVLTPNQSINPLDLKNIEIRTVGKLGGHLWEQVELPMYARDGFLLNLCNTGPVLKTNQAVAIHDAAVCGFPSSYSFSFKVWYKFLYSVLSKIAKRILTVSDFSKQELQKYFHIPEEKINVVIEGREHFERVHPDEGILRKHDLVDEPYILAVSSLNPNKNFNAVIKALEILGDKQYKVVIAGGTNSKVFKDTALTEQAHVIQVGYVSDEELKALYRNASCFIYPSFYEGFGLPPLEAMTSGCPVIVSDRASMPEVCGDAALYCNPDDPANIAGKIDRVMKDESLKQKMSTDGLKRAEAFSWKKCAQQVLGMMDEVFAK